MGYELVGKLHKKFDTEQKSDSFKTRDFVVEIQDGNYPQFIKFQTVQDRCDAIDPYNEGDEVKVYFDLRGREWQGRYFTNLNAWRVEGNTSTEAIPSGTEEVPMPEEPPMTLESDDLPF